MRRLFWLAAGAVGGVYAYRKGTEAAAQAKDRGMVGNVQVLQQTATTVTDRARSVRGHLVRPPAPTTLEPLAPLPPTTSGTPPRVRANGA